MNNGQTIETAPAKHKTFQCSQCRGDVQFDPSSQKLVCKYCGNEENIPQSEEEIPDIDFAVALKASSAGDTMETVREFNCKGCGANVHNPEDDLSMDCPFCGLTLIQTDHTKNLMRPHAVLPFAVSQEESRDAFRKWLSKLWFAESHSKKYARENAPKGVYLPYWKFDTNAVTFYRGKRGHSVTVRTGKNTTTTHIQWVPVSGTVSRFFDDFLVPSAYSVPKKYLDKLEPWQLPNMVSYSEEYLAGFEAQSYQVDPAEGFQNAKEEMEKVIRSDVTGDIGGQAQQVDSIRTDYRNLKVSHVLLPVWVFTYRYKSKVYTAVVNAQTGEVQGEYPLSKIRVAAAAIGVLGVLAGVIYVIAQSV